MRPAIVETVMSQLVAEGLELHNAVIKSERDAAVQRVLMGRFLIGAREKLPRRARSASEGWMAFLEAIEMSHDTASRYIALAEATLTLNVRNNDDVKLIPNYEQLGLTKREGPQPPDDLPDPSDDDAPPETTRVHDSNDTGSDADEQAPAPTQAAPVEDEVEIDRDTWCTPRWITDAIGEFDLDPCANERSHVNAIDSFILDRGQDGLVLAAGVEKKSRVFINPPYSDVRPWIDAYAHTRFCFLLKFDTSTAWFEALLEHCELVLHPRRTRVEFEAPPEVPKDKSGANQFPHSLFYARAADATRAIQKLCYPPWRIR